MIGVKKQQNSSVTTAVRIMIFPVWAGGAGRRLSEEGMRELSGMQEMPYTLE